VIPATTGHRSMTVLRRYIREGNLFNENAASAVGRNSRKELMDRNGVRRTFRPRRASFTLGERGGSE
jgi:hypothetical protein